MGKIKQDKFLHLETSALLVVVFGLFLPWWAASVVAFGIGIGKELWDKYHDGVPSWADVGADLIGVALGALISLIRL